jgi:hypothetical protein
MTRRNNAPEASLPVRPRPHHGESADSYLRWLAAANHLRFSGTPSPLPGTIKWPDPRPWHQSPLMTCVRVSRQAS